MSFYNYLTKSSPYGKMAREVGLIEQSTLWDHKLPPTRDPSGLEDKWHLWAIHETTKRYLLVFV
jgi:hypothetical protein